MTTKEILSITDGAKKYHAMYDKGDNIKNNPNIKEVIKELNKYLKEVLADNNQNRGDLRTIGIICKPAKDKGLNQELWQELNNRLNQTKKII